MISSKNIFCLRANCVIMGIMKKWKERGRALEDIVVGIGDIKIARGECPIVTYALGSCVGICLYDESTGLGGMLHAMLPTFANGLSGGEPEKYVDSGLVNLYNMLCYRGAARKELKAKLIGGARMFEYKTTMDALDIGTANVLQARATLRNMGIALVREVTGGEVGRTIRFIPGSGVVTIHSTDYRTEVV